MTVTIGARGARSAFDRPRRTGPPWRLGRRPARRSLLVRRGDRGRRLRDLVAELARNERRRVAVDELVDAREDAALDELADDVRGVHVEQRREFLDGDRAGQLDRAALARVGDLDRPVATGRSRRWGLRGPRRPRVPLLLLANGSSFISVSIDRWLGVSRWRGGVTRPGGRRERAETSPAAPPSARSRPSARRRQQPRPRQR